MKKLLLFCGILLLISSTFTAKKFKTSTLFSIKYVSETPGNLDYVSAILKESALDSLEMMRKREIAITYLLGQQVNKDSLKQLYPDTQLIESAFHQMIDEPEFSKAVYALLYPETVRTEQYSMEEIMSIASRFFYVFKTKNNYGFSICSSANGIEHSELAQQKIVEALVLEAVMSHIVSSQNGQPQIVSDAYSYLKDAIGDTTLNTKEKRLRIYQKMEQNESLKSIIKSFFENEKAHLPMSIKNV